MKKLICTLMLLCLVLTACGGNDATTGTQPSQNNSTASTNSAQSGTNTPVASGYVFTYKEVSIQMNAEASTIVAALGEPKSYTEETSCAFDGLDKTYYYGSFYMQTYPLAGKDYVYSLWIVDDSVTTPEGLYIGAPQAQVEQVFGTDGYNGSNAFILVKDACQLTIIITDGVISSIQYDTILG